MGTVIQNTRLELTALLKQLEQFACIADDQGATQTESLNALRQSGLLGSLIPVEYGGLGQDASFASHFIAAVATVDPSIAIIAFQHISVVSRILEWGSDSLRQKYLPHLADGTWLAASAWSETGAGANKQNLSSKAVPLDNDHWLIKGTKSFTTGAGLADLYLVLVQTGTNDTNSVYGNSSQSFFLIETTQGITADADTNLAGMRGSSTGFIYLNNCHVPKEQLIGSLGSAPAVIQGIRRCGLTLGAVSLGISQAAYEMALNHLHDKGLANNPQLQSAMSDLHVGLEAVRALVEKVAAKQGGEHLEKIAYQAKIFASETSESICRNAQQIIGGASYVRGHKLERLLRDARAVALMGPVNRLAKEIIGKELVL